MDIKNFLDKNNVTFKGLWVGFMVLILMIPIFQISDLLRDRRMRQTDAINDISQKWSGGQSILGPIVVIPYQQWSADRKLSVTLNAYLLPEQLDIESNVIPEIRHRGIYDVVIYNTEIKLQGSFQEGVLKNLNLDSADINWQDVSIQIGLSDFRGIKDQVSLEYNGKNSFFSTGVATNDILHSGLKVPLTESNRNLKGDFVINLALKGSQYLFFAPIGKITNVNMKSSWASPSFSGAFLPNEKATITDAGFEANWKVLDLNRNYPQYFKAAKFPIEESMFGVNFIQPGDSYTQTDRATKYAFLFIGLTFAIYFFIEILQKKKAHSFQYVLVGLALCLFYLLLLSLSEYINFPLAYLVAATSVVGLIGWYTNAVFKSGKIAGLFTFAVVLLYVFIYVLIQLQEKALLIGSISLFVLLALVMYMTRMINWEEKEF